MPATRWRPYDSSTACSASCACSSRVDRLVSALGPAAFATPLSLQHRVRAEVARIGLPQLDLSLDQPLRLVTAHCPVAQPDGAEYDNQRQAAGSDPLEGVGGGLIARPLERILHGRIVHRLTEGCSPQG